ncbi:MAG TPA: hypothetical protein PKE47_03810, partial [Verrucomicrobiota bacterium]|nr:hypothetical protein [Verrucomicrobiota bacterium]
GLCAGPACAGGPRIVKVLPLLLDEQGRSAPDPSLFERDAYQAELRAAPERVSGVRFEVLTRRVPRGRPVTVRLALRGGAAAEAQVVEVPWAGRGAGVGRWTKVFITGDDYRRLGRVVAWRASLHDEAGELAHASSFLWRDE